MKAICHIQTPFDEKFGVPRQSLLIHEAWGKLSFPKNDFYAEAFRGIETNSHLWLIFEFHLIATDPINALVRPPRFSGKDKLGVFATRSPHRPNRLGLSVVKFDHLEMSDKEVHLWVSGVDLVNGTPILDIKPYVPYVDSVPVASAQMFIEAPPTNPVIWSCSHELSDDIKQLIEKVIGLDPRPGHQKEDLSEYGVSIAGHNVRFKKDGSGFVILEVK